jgi:hypothetical protein
VFKNLFRGVEKRSAVITSPSGNSCATKRFGRSNQGRPALASKGWLGSKRAVGYRRGAMERLYSGWALLGPISFG